jgi:hypothetical protein
VFSARCLFFGKGHAPAGSSTAVKGARVHLRQQEEYMTVSLYFFCKLWILHVGTGVRSVEYSGHGCTSTDSLARGVQ